MLTVPSGRAPLWVGTEAAAEGGWRGDAQTSVLMSKLEENPREKLPARHLPGVGCSALQTPLFPHFVQPKPWS